MEFPQIQDEVKLVMKTISKFSQFAKVFVVRNDLHMSQGRIGLNIAKAVIGAYKIIKSDNSK